MTQGSAGAMNKSSDAKSTDAKSTGAKSTDAKTSAGPAVRTAKSKECSAQADQQGLHGKARKAFRGQCRGAAALSAPIPRAGRETRKSPPGRAAEGLT